MIATPAPPGDAGTPVARRRSAWWACGMVALLLMLAPPSPAQQSFAEFIRIDADPQGQPRTLEVAIAGFEREDGARVDLVGAVHIGEPAYFQLLNQRLSGYQRVLYELVADPDAATAHVRGPATPGLAMVALMQGGMRKALGMAFQLDEIDYSQPHFVHADLTPREFSATMAERDESLGGLLVRAWALGMAQQTGAAAARANADLLKVLLASDRQMALRRMLARQMVEQGDLLKTIAGPDGSTLIEGRNARALEVLERELAAGHDHLAIFYGAGHLPDFARRLEYDLGFRHVGTEWIAAWNLEAR